MTSHDIEHIYTPDDISEEDLEYIQASSLGRQLEWGDSLALLVIDMTEEFTSDEYSLGREDTSSRAVEGIKDLLEMFRKSDLPIYYTKPAGKYPGKQQGVWKEKKFDPPVDSRPGNRITPDLEPKDDEVVLEKGKPSAFFSTPLEEMLRYQGVNTVIITGMVTSGCIRATVVDACSRNFKAIVPEECTADRAEISHQVNLFEIDLKYGDVLPLGEVLEKGQKFA